MPSVFKKQEPNRLVLKSDLTESPQPAFFARRLTFGQMKAFMALMTKLQSKDAQMADVFDDLIDTLEDTICGWEHMGSFVHGIDKLADFLSPSEVLELVMLVLDSSNLSAETGNE